MSEMCSVAGCEELARHYYRFEFAEDLQPITHYCNRHAEYRGEESPCAVYLGEELESEEPD